MPKIKPWTVYILKCADGSLYTGITTNIDRRLREHGTKKGAHYTRSRTPLTLVYQESYANRSEASKREYEIKALPRAEKFQLIANL